MKALIYPPSARDIVWLASNLLIIALAVCAARAEDDWRIYNRTLASGRFSPLAQAGRVIAYGADEGKKLGGTQIGFAAGMISPIRPRRKPTGKLVVFGLLQARPVIGL